MAPEEKIKQIYETNKRNNAKFLSIFIIPSLVFSAMLAVHIWMAPDEKELAKAQGLAYQILEIRRKTLIQTGLNSRGPASAIEFAKQGRISQGPDGEPYHYAFSEEDQYWSVQIWANSNPTRKTEVRIRRDQLKEN